MHDKSYKLAKEVMQARAAHSEKLTRRDDDINMEVKRLHEQAFNSYGHAERLLKMNGDSAIFAAKRHLEAAKKIEEEIAGYYKAKSRELSRQRRIMQATQKTSKQEKTKVKNPLNVKKKKVVKPKGGDHGFGGIAY